MDREVAVGRLPHVPDDADARRNRPALEFLGFGVESHERVRPLRGLVVPDDVVDEDPPGLYNAAP
jgi:hypothetical protein